ncbi:hypothetical protein BGZ99_003234 [Dissophora globulifera]|uniref:Uncharacterized protein n=1 Tax=Dissophora globulifera TaxID=979702 RepID=A0A9P6UWC1_9FUNG|nr:hypothetical protein BGZ99_003234 [Dissophora globulifera]
MSRRRASWGLPLTPTRIPILPQPAKAPQGVRQHRHTKSLSNGSNSPRPPFFLTMSKITAEQDDKDLTNAEVDQILDVVMDDAIEMYTPRSLSSSTSSTPTWLTECSSAHSSPALSSSSPQTFMLQGFLERHSNGHIMYRKPIHSSTNCPDCRLLPPTFHLDDTDDDHDTSDQRFLLLAQSPNPSEFELSDFVSTESQKAARLHQADSPVFFNGFPLLQMAARER